MPICASAMTRPRTLLAETLMILGLLCVVYAPLPPLGGHGTPPTGSGQPVGQAADVKPDAAAAAAAAAAARIAIKINDGDPRPGFPAFGGTPAGLCFSFWP